MCREPVTDSTFFNFNKKNTHIIIINYDLFNDNIIDYVYNTTMLHNLR